MHINQDSHEEQRVMLLTALGKKCVKLTKTLQQEDDYRSFINLYNPTIFESLTLKDNLLKMYPRLTKSEIINILDSCSQRYQNAIENMCVRKFGKM